MARPTLVSLAAELGVSRQTVSNVINAPHLVKMETRERVQAAIEASGYRPNLAAQTLRNQRSRTVAMRIYPTVDAGINGAVMDRFLHQLVQVLARHGYGLTLVTADGFDDEVATLREMHVRGAIDAAILTDTHHGDTRPDQLAAAGLGAVAAFGRPWGAEDRAEHVWVDIDSAAGTRLATRTLLQHGYRRIGWLGWGREIPIGLDRRQGWLDAMREAGRGEACEQWQAGGIDRMETGITGMEQLVERGVEAVVCASDSLALGAMEVLRRCGPAGVVGVPVVGYDNTAVARALGIASLEQPVEEAVRLICDELVARLGGEERHERPHLLEPTLERAELIPHADCFAPNHYNKELR